MESADAMINVEVIYAEPQQVFRKHFSLPEGAKAGEALRQFWLAYPQVKALLEARTYFLGIFGERCTENKVLHTGERLEIYRPLLCDPKKVRKAQSSRKK